MFLSSFRQLRRQDSRPAARGPRAARRSQVLRYRPRLDAFEDRTLLAVKTWIGGAFQDVCQGIRSGDPNAWSNPLNWLGGLPGPADTAAFVDRILVATCPGGDVFGPFTTNAVVDAAFSGLVAGINSGWAGTITLARELTLTTNSVWSSGDIASGTLTNTGTLAVSGGRLFGATLNNANRINQTGGTFTLAADNGVGGTLVNQGSAIYDFVGDGAIQGAGAAAGTSRTFVNQGLLRKSAGTGTSILEGSTNGITFNSSGLIEVAVGTLRVASGGLSTGGIYTAWDGVLDLSPATSHAYQGTFVVEGQVQLRSGIFDVTGGFQLYGGDFQWQGGEIFGGRWENKAYVYLEGAGDKTLRGAVLINRAGGYIDHYAGRLVLAAENGVGGTVENLPEASYNVNGDTPVAIVGSGVGGGNSRTFINRGYFTKYDVGTFTVAGGSEGVTFHNSGELYAYEGTIRINAGGTFTGGRYDASGGGVIDLAGSATYEGTLTGGGGRVQLRGTMTIGPAGVTLQLPFYWQGGTITGGTLTNAGGLTLEGGDLTLHRAVLNNTAQIIHASGNLILSAENGVGGTLVNLSGAAYFADANGGGVSGTGVGGGTSRTFVNQGSILRRSQAGPGTFTFAGGASGVNLDNSGYVEARSGTLAAANVAQITGTTLTGGTWTVRSATTLNLADGRGLTVNNANVTLDGVGANFVNLSSLAVNGGSLSLVNEAVLALAGALRNDGLVSLVDGGVLASAVGYTQTASGITELDGGGLAAPTIQLDAGSRVLGTGTLSGNVRNAGQIIVGGDDVAGFFLVYGDYTQTASGTVFLELGDIMLGEYDQLVVTGTAALEGQIVVETLPRFAPIEGLAYPVLWYGARGAGTPTVTVPNLGAEFYLDPVFDPFTLTLWLRRNA